jgi:hypothetical protein
VKQSFQSALPAHFASSKYLQNEALMRVSSKATSQQSIRQGSLSLCANRTAHSASQPSQSGPQLLLM